MGEWVGELESEEQDEDAERRLRIYRKGSRRLSVP